VVELPSWAVVTPGRLGHIARVVALLDQWALMMELPVGSRAALHDAGAWHDALRDAASDSLGPPPEDPTLPPGAWHGPAAARLLERDGETRTDVLDAIRWHTVGHSAWEFTGRALFCADFLEPGRLFLRDERARLARQFAYDPATVLREVVRMRLDLAMEQRSAVHPRTQAFWESLQ
jgi:HD superfamily phosphohydrolase YqeK